MAHRWQTLAVQLQSKLERTNLSITFFLSRRMKGRDSVSASFFLVLCVGCFGRFGLQLPSRILEKAIQVSNVEREI